MGSYQDPNWRDGGRISVELEWVRLGALYAGLVVSVSLESRVMPLLDPTVRAETGRKIFNSAALGVRLFLFAW